MKTVVVLIEKKFVCPVAVSVPDWWDDATARERLSTPETLGLLDDAAYPADWEETDEEPAVRCVRAPAGPALPILGFHGEEPPTFFEYREWRPA